MITLLISMFKSMGESVTLSVQPDYPEEGEILEYGWVIIKGNKTIFGRYGNIPELIEEFTLLIQEAEAQLPDFDEMTESEKIETIREVYDWMENPD